MAPQPPSGFKLEPLSSSHDRERFRSGVDALDHYLHRQAGQDSARGATRVYVLVDEGHGNVAGYYTLSAFTISLSELPPDVAKRLPRYPHVPATLLGRLAVSQDYRGQRLGSFLLLSALHLSLQVSREVASAAVVADTKDESAKSFYEHYGFRRLQSRPMQLFLPMKTVEQVFSGELTYRSIFEKL